MDLRSKLTTKKISQELKDCNCANLFSILIQELLFRRLGLWCLAAHLTPPTYDHRRICGAFRFSHDLQLAEFAGRELEFPLPFRNPSVGDFDAIAGLDLLYLLIPEGELDRS